MTPEVIQGLHSLVDALKEANVAEQVEFFRQELAAVRSDAAAELAVIKQEVSQQAESIARSAAASYETRLRDSIAQAMLDRAIDALKKEEFTFMWGAAMSLEELLETPAGKKDPEKMRLKHLEAQAFPQNAARFCYKMADAMLDARKKPDQS